MKKFNSKLYIKAFEEFKDLEIIAAGAYSGGGALKRVVVIADAKDYSFTAENIELRLAIFKECIKAEITLKAPTKEQEEYLSDKIDYISEGGFNNDIRKTYYFKERFKEHEEALNALRDFCKLYYKN